MPEIITLGDNLRIGDRSDPHFHWLTRSGGVALNGVEQVTSPLAGFWRWRPTLIVRNKSDARSWRTAKLQLKGRFNYLRMRVCDRYRLSRKEVGAYYAGDSVPYGDDTTHDDGTGHALAQPASALLASAAAGATTITVTASDFGGGLSSGLFFSIDDWLYQVTAWEIDGSDALLTFLPALRQSVTIGDIVRFDARSLWTLETDDDGDFDLDGGRFGGVALNLREPIGRLG